MRYDICVIVESNMADIPCEKYMYIPNGIAEKIKNILNWQNCTNEDKKIWKMIINAQKYPCLWSDAVCIGDTTEEAKEGSQVKIYVIRGNYDEKRDLFQIEIKNTSGKDGSLVLKIIKEKSFCVYEGEELLNLYRSFTHMGLN